ncbi:MULTISPECIES: nitrite/sulfite reductase [Bradyrhizobium]|jgi:sulfite reductase (NADPH) hemoprotein beta-component|uniref:Nitrite/sulfite reductase n=3 Tax=Bradyrhizobium TaxID=374 RepID=A0ABS5GFW7_9BRAD|nr:MULTISPECIES: nitrite/sulfite reductase [Bradyrhizobium]ABQ38867.1 Sulfite/ferredoxin-nitrite reductase [Bradyrhizobium sp. BTAi1]MBR1139929.1 nitrite/sulfite reductase [Bradyrhizobium denitrificans]MDU0955847.1 nitrite/sulfite reductase [Bradyrhizobium sp.]MDU1495012.1 nitrite/sulfite reductase [Bradyrhizobium sp.]MDU1545179.1 nitrite/sulfite reductase [Bradyrhizobium sp.]
MYAYDDIDRTLVNERVAEFRDQVKRRLSGELTEDEFKILRLQNGVYLQLHAYMYRIAIPYGTLSSEQLRRLAHVARRYDRGYGHFTTRQNIQFNWIKLAELPDAMADLAEVGIQSMQTSGNNMRNVTSDQWAGVAPGEVEDPRIWAELLRQFTTLHPEFSFLPRKFKIAITASAHDRAAIKIHDIGLRLLKNEQGETGFEVLVGGGLGRSPFIAKTIKPFVHGHDILSYVEAILRVYNQYGRRDNIYKARIKILVHELGIETFAAEVEEEWQQIRDGVLKLDDGIVEDIRSRFFYPAYETLPHMPDELRQAAHDPKFEAWRKNSVVAHKVQGYAIVTVSLKPIGKPPGDATADQMDALADIADKYSFGEIRVGHEQNLALPHVRKRDLPAVWKALDAIGLAIPNVNLVSDIIACPGLDYCSLANARSIPIAQEITRRFANHDTANLIGRLHINISGCINACGHHHVGHIGILGVEKNNEEFYQITIGGRADEGAVLGTLIGPAVPYAEVADVVEDIVEAYLALRASPEELFVDTVARLGVEPFRERVYATR